jgi:hypothetical protein
MISARPRHSDELDGEARLGCQDYQCVLILKGTRGDERRDSAPERWR